jgi:hypothetical protein
VTGSIVLDVDDTSLGGVGLDEGVAGAVGVSSRVAIVVVCDAVSSFKGTVLEDSGSVGVRSWAESPVGVELPSRLPTGLEAGRALSGCSRGREDDLDRGSICLCLS